MNTVKERNTTIDLAKYIAALLIIGIHTNLAADFNQTLGFVIVEIICRMAVPFFAVCTGYFLAPCLSWGGIVWKSNFPVLLKQEKKLIRLYIVWTILYLFFSIPGWIKTGWFSPWAFVDYAIGAVRDGAHYQLWYILGLIYALPLLYTVLPVINNEAMLPLSAGLYLVMIMFYSYSWLLPDGGGRFVELLSFSFSATAAVFLLIPMLLLGIRIRTGAVLSARTAWINFAVSAACFV